MNKHLLLTSRTLIIFGAFIFFCINSFSQNIISNRISATDSLVSTGSSNASINIELMPKTGNFRDLSVTNRIIFGVDHSDSIASNRFNARVILLMERWGINNEALEDQYIQLEINYNPFMDSTYHSYYIDRSTYLSTGAYKINLSLLEIFIDSLPSDSLPHNLFIDAEIEYDRLDNFNEVLESKVFFNPVLTYNLDCDTENIADEILISWEKCFTKQGSQICPGGFQYEYFFVNDYGNTPSTFLNETELAFDFKRNSTRVTTSNNYFYLPHVYEHGYLVFRVRAFSRNYINPEEIIYGAWSSVDNGYISDLTEKYFISNVFENKKNWIYSVNFSEDDKRNEVIHYFDGSSKNRQGLSKLNTDRTLLIDQTIYDHQGRPAIKVLPVPAENQCSPTSQEQGNSFNYKPNFNQNVGGLPYSRSDFDVDKSGDPCQTNTPGMSIASGASKYYSPNNPDTTGMALYVPDADQYPFSQTIYTPDNSGRIQSQGNVGSEYQTGTGHEIKNYYDVPNQLELGRMFGSEVGSAAHYKKNFTIDPNGQVTVTYLNLSGKTIATSMVGESRSDSSNRTILEPLKTGLKDADTLTIDLFARDARKHSLVNIIDDARGEISFTRPLVIPFNGVFEFDYTLVVDKISDPCLVDGICLSCIYDLEIKVLNECSHDLTSTITSDGNPLKKLIGNFVKDSTGAIEFKMYETNSQINHPEKFTLNLNTGSYFLSKKLTINKDAKSFYIDQYMDSSYNKCLKPFDDFLDSAVALIDTTDCGTDCQECATSLGNRDEYIASGRGTAMEYDLLLEACLDPCTSISWCDIGYEQMLFDVSKNGQYAEVKGKHNTISPENYPLSIFNVNNKLPQNKLNGMGNWRFPKTLINGIEYPGYYDEKGKRSEILVSRYSGKDGWMPQTVDLNLNSGVFYNEDGDYYYTYPENLLQVSEFYNRWEKGWERAMVQYHPEYCYYEICKGYKIPESFEKKGLTSDRFDEILITAGTFKKAVFSKLIKPNYKNPNIPSQLKINDFFTYDPDSVYDPFAIANSRFQTEKGAVKLNFHNSLINKFWKYKLINGIYYSMMDVASITARCGTKYGEKPDGSCFDAFGEDFLSGIPEGLTAAEVILINDSIRDLEWNLLKNFYLAEKFELQSERADEINLLLGCEGFGGCIKNKDFDPVMTNYKYWLRYSQNLKPLEDTLQPCHINSAKYYKLKEKRFNQKPEQPDANQSAYQFYLRTGQCPLANHLELFLNSMIENKKLVDGISLPLNLYAAFSERLYNDITNNSNVSFTNFKWEVSEDFSKNMHIQIKSPGLPAKGISLFPGGTGSGFLWKDVIGLDQIKYLNSPSPGQYNFEAFVKIQNPTTGNIKFYKISGSTGFNINDCEFKPICNPNDLTISFGKLLNVLTNKNLINQQDLPLDKFLYLIKPHIANHLNPWSKKFVWNYNAADTLYELFSTVDSSKKIILKFNSFDPPAFSESSFGFTIKTLSEINSNYEHFFTIKGSTTYESDLVSINGSIFLSDHGNIKPLNTGTCDMPQPLLCQGDEYLMTRDLTPLLRSPMYNKGYRDSINFLNETACTQLIRDYLPPDTDTSTSIILRDTINGLFYNTLLISFWGYGDTCNISLNNSGSISDNYFGNITALGDVIPSGGSYKNAFYDFMVPVFVNTGESQIKDTLFGSGCLPLNSCYSNCTEIQEPPCYVCNAENFEIHACFNEWRLLMPPGNCQGKIFTYTYNWGDGTIDGSGEHEYRAPGTYQVEIKVENPSSDCLPYIIKGTLYLEDCGDSLSEESSSIYRIIYEDPNDEVKILKGEKLSDPILESYYRYKDVISEFNEAEKNNGIKPVKIEPVTFSEYSGNAYHKAEANYFQFIKNYDPEIDDEKHLRSLENFMVEKGCYKDSKNEYRRYTRSVELYNERVVSKGFGDSKSPITEDVFHEKLFADKITHYIKYLETQPEATIPLKTEMEIFESAELPFPEKDTCAKIYDRYVNTYNNFLANKDSACNYNILLNPMLSLEEFRKNNFCDGNEGLQAFHEYIEGFKDQLDCPPVAPSALTRRSMRVLVNSCSQNYNIYKNKIIEYNKSPFAMDHGHKLVWRLYTSFKRFQQAGLCECVDNYISYLNNYIAASPDAELEFPSDINNFEACNIQFPAAKNECDTAYQQYLDLITAYNDFTLDSLNESWNLAPISTFYSDSTFDSLKLCYCIDGYKAYLSGIMDSTADLSMAARTSLYKKYDIAELCKPYKAIPCVPVMPPDTVYSPVYVQETDPCLEFQMGFAKSNATLDYNNYLEEMRRMISAKYLDYCMDASEKFSMRYPDKEYHYTLYYYDLAGNLVKTVPPEGVQLLNLKSYEDSLAIAINNDLTYGTQKIKTAHELASCYEYNSLDQLIRQTIPDHDNMNLWELNEVAGLPSDLGITSTQFITPSRGFLTGNNQESRGSTYTTNDGGNSWDLINDISGTNWNKVQCIDKNIAYAVGSGGSFLKTKDGGSSWDLSPMYELNIISNLNDLKFLDPLKGIIVGDNGVIIRTINGGTEFTNISPTGMGQYHFTSITHDGSKFYVCGNHNVNSTSIILKGTINSLSDLNITWSAQTSIRGVDHNKVNYFPSIGLITGSNSGYLLKSITGKDWNNIETNVTGDFKDVYFSSKQAGVAIIEKDGKRTLMKTSNEGKTWELFGEDSTFVNALYFNSIDKKCYALGPNGSLKKIITVDQFGAAEIQGLPSNANLSAACIINGGIGIITDYLGNIYYSENVSAIQPKWSVHSTGITDAIIEIFYKNGTGLLLTDSGIVFRIMKTETGFEATQISSANEFFVDMQETQSKIYFYDRLSNKVKYFEYASLSTYAVGSSSSIFIPVSTTGTILPKSENVRSIAMRGDVVVLAGKQGDIYSLPLKGTIKWADNSANIKSNPRLNDIQSTGEGKIFAVGENGTLLQTSNGENWKYQPVKDRSIFHSIKGINDSIGFIAGTNGFFKRFIITSSGIQFQKMNLFTTNHLYDIVIKDTSMYVCGEDGLVVEFSGTGLSAVPVYSQRVSSFPVKGIDLLNPGEYAFGVGAGSLVSAYYGIIGLKLNSIYLPGLNDIHFVNSTTGFMVGDKGIIRYTSNGGATWKTLHPNLYPSGNKFSAGTLNGVWTINDSTAFTVGSQGYIARVYSGGNTEAISALGSRPESFNRIVFDNKNFGHIIGDNSNQPNYLNISKEGILSNGNINSLSLGYNFKGLHIFENNHLMMVGNKGLIAYFDGNQWKEMASGFNSIEFTDVSFIDQRNGYVSGTDGTLLKGTLYDKMISGNITREATWKSMVPQEPDDLISAVELTSRRTGFMGGSKTGKTIAGVFADEEGKYSQQLWYDKAGRLVLSQNSRQYNRAPKRLSYTRFDDLGRIIETGEVNENNPANNLNFKSIFGSEVGGEYNPAVIDQYKLNTWLEGGEKHEVSKTWYDKQTIIPATILSQENLRNRMATITFSEEDSLPYNHATHYSYDIHGNVKTIVQDNPKLATIAGSSEGSHQYKRIDYDYDLISGNVKKVSYQKDKPDQFYHKYFYDADNRLKSVETSRDGIYYEQDVKYFYYPHGPLARVELGHNKVQGIDYAYTLQGWIKGVNSNTLASKNDIGKDGEAGNINEVFAKDVFGYSLGYFDMDYIPIGNMADADNFLASNDPNSYKTKTPGLFNGNISLMVTSITNPSTGEILPNGNAYRYDQLNRLIESQSYQNLNLTTNTWEGTTGYNGSYNNKFSYDGNGNILTQDRADASGVVFDKLKYNYQKNAEGRTLRNRLYHVNDSITDHGLSTDDIENQGTFNNDSLIAIANNYSYDETGNLIKDKAEDIAEIKWNASGKVKAILRSDTSNKPELTFDYDATGQRIAKHVFVNDVLKTSTYYVRDAQGNILGIYELKNDDSSRTQSFKIKERNIYGSSRIGSDNTEVEFIGFTPADSNKFEHVLGNKRFEGSNHLSNVLTIFSDMKISVDGNNDGVIESWKADVVGSMDYYGFGSGMRERTFGGGRYGFNGQEKVDEINGLGNAIDFGERIYDSRIGRFLSVDKLTGSYPWWSPYSFAGNTPIQAIDLDGLEIYYAQSGQLIGTYGTSTEIRVLNEDQVATAINEFAAYTNAIQTDPSATNTYLGSGALTGSVAFGDYFTTNTDVTNDAALETYTEHGNCFDAAKAQCENEGVNPGGPGNSAINTMVANGDNLTENKIGGAIYIQTQLNAGNPIMIGVKETKTDGTSPDPGNTNSNTGHFVVVRSSSVATDGTVTFNYLDNAKASTGKSSNNNFTLNKSTGSLIDNTTPGGRTNYSDYEVSEVRKNP